MKPYRINEIFFSLQGEGARAGQASGAQRLLGATFSNEQVDVVTRAAVVVERDALAPLVVGDVEQLRVELGLGARVGDERLVGLADRLERARPPERAAPAIRRTQSVEVGVGVRL